MSGWSKVDKRDIARLISIATANFPSMQEKDMRPTAVLWEKALSDIPYEVAEKALIKVLATSRFFPTVAEIREAATELTQPRMMDWSEAWGLIGQAIRRHGFYGEAEAMAELPEDVARMAKRFGWRDLCLNENVDVMRAHFKQAWEIEQKRKQEVIALPTEIRSMIEGLADKMKMLPDKSLAE